MKTPLIAAEAGVASKSRVTEERRMWLNGETREQMDYARAVKAAGGVSLNPADGRDTSKDQKWEYYQKPKTDMYVMITTIPWALKFLTFPIMFLLGLPTVLIARTYISMVPDGTERIHRSGFFYLFWFGAVLCTLPAFVGVIVSLIWDYTFYYVFSVLYCTCTCNWRQAFKGFEKIQPVRGGPSIWCRPGDIFQCVMGQSMRHGILETCYHITMMWYLMPWLKYYICCNPYIYDLDHRLVQQISTTMEDLGTAREVSQTARRIISRGRQFRAQAHRLDRWSFVPHYPYPPRSRRWAIGMQAGGGSYPAKFTLLVHSTHYDSKAGLVDDLPDNVDPCFADKYQDPNQDEHFVLSNSVARPVYRVMLWYNNPFHFLTGWVEASITNGEPSQTNKNLGGEHPMWLVSGHTPLTSGRDSYTGSGLIDAFFDYWLPVFVHECRRSTIIHRLVTANEERVQNGKEPLPFDQVDLCAERYADKKYQEVVSVDGISAPDKRIGLNKYGGKDAYHDYLRAEKGQRKKDMQALDGHLDRLSEVPLFAELAKYFQNSEELV